MCVFLNHFYLYIAVYCRWNPNISGLMEDRVGDPGKTVQAGCIVHKTKPRLLSEAMPPVQSTGTRNACIACIIIATL